jgi:diguanylate cyclase (GGDEF)-like protein
MRVERAWPRLAAAVALAGLAMLAAVLVATEPGSPANEFFMRWVYQGLIVLAVVIAGARAITAERDRAAWWLLTVSLACWAFGDIYYAVALPEAYPSIADYGWLAFYPLVYAGIVLLLSRRARSIGGTLWLDGATASLAAAALGAAVLVGVVLRSTEGSLGTVATNLAYPLGDVLLLSAVFGVFSLTRWRPGRRWLLLGLGIACTALADAVYLIQSAEGTYVEGTWLDVLWPASMLLIALASWVPERSDRGLDVEGRPLLAVPAACALVALSILLYDHFEPVNLLAVVLATATMLAVVVRLAITFRENRRLYELTRHEATTDALTGLGNRRKLLSDLERRLGDGAPGPTLLMIFDLDGFKSYNDTFGHPAGDALLTRLGTKLAEVPGPDGAAYRLGGDEFCLVSPVGDGEAEGIIDRACDALSERGDGFEIGSSFGAVLLPDEADEPSRALHVADERLYAQKHSRRAGDDRTMQTLREALALRDPALGEHLDGVAALALETGRRLGLGRDELDTLARAAQLHDLGKLAVPDEILHKAGEFDEREWEFVRQHPLVGERILRASPALRDAGAIVRSTHEHWDGSGYPDGLAGEEIPLAARIICACDTYESMTSERPYRSALMPAEALAELERASGTRFDPAVAHVLADYVREGLEAAEQAA